MKINTPRYKVVLERDTTYTHTKMELDTPQALASFVRPIIENETQEVFLMVALDTKLDPIGIFEVHRGTISSSIINLADVAKRLLLVNAHQVIFAHNHPSGDSYPSQADMDVTDALGDMLNLFGITMLDHIIVGYGECFSIRAHDRMYD